MDAFMRSLRRLQALDVDRIYPGHFRVLDRAREVIADLIAHRTAREAAIVAALTNRPVTIDEIVSKAYADTPLRLHPVAAFSVAAHLQSLERRGLARRMNDRWAAAAVD